MPKIFHASAIDTLRPMAAETDLMDLSNASAEELRRFMNSDAALTPEQQLHRSAWTLADALQKGKNLTSEEVETVMEKFSRMLSRRTDYDADSAEFVELEKKHELARGPPRWLPKLMQENSSAAQESSTDLQDLVNSSQLDAENRREAGRSIAETESHQLPARHSSQSSTDSSNSAAAGRASARLSAADQEDIEQLLELTLDDAYETEKWPARSFWERIAGTVRFKP